MFLELPGSVRITLIVCIAVCVLAITAAIILHKGHKI